MSSSDQEYILGTGNDELERLGIQHRAWAAIALASWKRAGIGPGSAVADVGCGPGYASLDLAELVSASGRVLAIDESKPFVNYLNQKAQSSNLKQLHAVVADVTALSSALGPVDAAYCRWVLCWLKNPERALDGIASILKPGGRLVVHDYFNWKTMTTGPRSAAIEKMVAAAQCSFLAHDGDVDLAGRLPKLLRGAGFRILHLDIHQRIARGGGLDSELMAWPMTWWRSYGPKLVEAGFLADLDYKQAERDLTLVEQDPDQFFYCPPVFEFIAEKII